MKTGSAQAHLGPPVECKSGGPPLKSRVSFTPISPKPYGMVHFSE